MKLMTKEQIISMAHRKRTQDVFVKEWDGYVRVRELTASERDAWESESFRLSDDGKSTIYNYKDVRARLVVRCIVDEAGHRLFTDDERAAIGSLSASSVQALFNAASKLNAISKEDLKELEGNSAAGPSAGGSSTSVSVSA